jgi:hypothetical protein
VRAVLLSLFSDIIGRDLPSSLLAQLLKLWFVHYSFIIHADPSTLSFFRCYCRCLWVITYIYKDTLCLFVNQFPSLGRKLSFLMDFLEKMSSLIFPNWVVTDHLLYIYTVYFWYG